MIMDELRSEFSFFDKDNPQHEVNKNADPVTSNRSINDDADSSSTIDENLEIESVASSVEDRLSWRGRLQVVIHSLPVQLFVLTLVVLDTLIVLVELLLDFGAFGNKECSESSNLIEQANFCHYNTKFRSQCPPSPTILNFGENLTSGNGKDYCVCAYRAAKYTCAIGGKGTNPADIFHFLSLAILTLFLFEIFLKLVAFQLKFFTHKFEILDAVVVIVAWILDVSSSLGDEEAFFQLIIIIRLWRIIRIVNGGVLSAKTHSNKNLQHARVYARDTVHALHKAQRKLQLQKDDIHELSNLLEVNNISLPELPSTVKEVHIIPEYPYDEEEGIAFKNWR